MIPHQMRGQCAHSHESLDDLMACEFDALEVFDRFARAFEDAA